MKKHLTRFAKIAISALLLGLIISRMNAENVLQTLRAVDLRFALAALAVSHLDRILQAGKWWLLLRQSGQQLPLRIAIANTYVGNFAGLFLPASVGGDFVRVFLLKAFPIQMSEVVASIVVERVFGVLALVFTAAGALLLADTAGVQVPEPVRWLVLPVFGGLLVAIAASFRLRSGIPAFVLRLGERFHLQRRLESLTGSYRRYGKRKIAILTYFALSVLEVLTVTVIFLLFARAVGIPLPPAAAVVMVPVTLFVQRLPISVGGLGVSEGTLTWFLVSFGFDLDRAVALALLSRANELLTLLPGAVGWLAMRRRGAAEAASGPPKSLPGNH